MEGAQRALIDEKKKRKRGKALFEEIRAEDGQGATFFSPQKIQQAKDLWQQREEAKKAEQRDKAIKAAAKKEEQLSKQKAIEQQKINRLQKAKEREETAKTKAIEKEQAKQDKQVTAQL